MKRERYSGGGMQKHKIGWGYYVNPEGGGLGKLSTWRVGRGWKLQGMGRKGTPVVTGNTYLV